MVALGYDNTLPVTMDEMIHHCKAVARATKRPLLIGDMPFGSYEASEEVAVNNSIRFLKEGGVDAIKLEGGKVRAKTIMKIVSSGVAVCGHIGLTPQSVSVLGGFRPQGRTAAAAKILLEDALALQEAGCFAIVIECVPAAVAAIVTNALRIPTIGIGSGNQTSGQVLVYHDLLGMISHPHHEEYAPRFCKQYAQIGRAIQVALNEFRKEVVAGDFPNEQYSPYKISDAELSLFQSSIAPSSQSVEKLFNENDLPIIDPVKNTVSSTLDKDVPSDVEILYSKKSGKK